MVKINWKLVFRVGLWLVMIGKINGSNTRRSVLVEGCLSPKSVVDGSVLNFSGLAFTSCSILFQSDLSSGVLKNRVGH